MISDSIKEFGELNCRCHLQLEKHGEGIDEVNLAEREVGTRVSEISIASTRAGICHNTSTRSTICNSWSIKRRKKKYELFSYGIPVVLWQDLFDLSQHS